MLSTWIDVKFPSWFACSYIIRLSPEGEVKSGGNIYRDAKRRDIYLALFTDPKGDSCFSIYQKQLDKYEKSNLL